MIEELKNAVRRSGWSLYELSRRTQGAVVTPELSLWLRGKRRLGERKLEAVAVALKVHLVTPSTDETPGDRRARIARAKAALARAASRVPAARNAELAADLLSRHRP